MTFTETVAFLKVFICQISPFDNYMSVISSIQDMKK